MGERVVVNMKDVTGNERTPLLRNNQKNVQSSRPVDSGFSPLSNLQSRTSNEDITSMSETNYAESSSNGEEPGSLQKISSTFESLDYDIAENMPYQEEEAQSNRSPEKIVKVNVYRWIVMLIIGIFTALIAVCIDILINIIAGFKYTLIKRYIDECTNKDCMAIPFCLWIVVDVAFVAIAAVLVVYIEPVASGSGIPQIKCYLNGVKIPHVVRIKTLFAKVVGVTFSVAGGLAVGKEGPMIHSGAVIAAGVSQGRSTTFNKDFKVFECFRTDQEKRDFVSGGAAAGVAAAFGAPVGGVLFSLEEGASFWNQSLTWRIFFCSMISSFTLNLMLSVYHQHPFDLSYPGLLNFGTFSGVPYQGHELPLFLIMAIIGGLLGALFNAINHHVSVFRMKFVKQNWLRVTEALLVAALSACAAFVMIYFYNDCKTEGSIGINISSPLQFFCEDGAFSAMGTLVFNTPEESIKNLFHTPRSTYNLETLIIFSPVYFLLATWTYGLYVPSGLFIPCLLTGASWGRLFGEVLHRVFPGGNWVDPGKYALIGAAATLGGVVRMTISLTVIVMEASGDITYGLPLMLTFMLAKWVGDYFNEGLYDIHIKLQSVPLLGWDAPEMAASFNASDIMNSPVICFRTKEKVRKIVEILKRTDCHHNGFPVVDHEELVQDGDKRTYGRFRGLILRSQLIILLKQKVFFEADKPYKKPHLKLKDFRDAYPRFPPIRNINISPREQDCYMDLTPYMNPAPYTVHEGSSLPRVFRLFRALGLRHLVVVDDSNNVVGIVTRKDLCRYRMWAHRGQTGLEEVHILDRSGTT